MGNVGFDVLRVSRRACSSNRSWRTSCFCLSISAASGATIACWWTASLFNPPIGPDNYFFSSLNPGMAIGHGLGRAKNLPATLEIPEETRDQTHLLITLTEGRNRQIRRLAEDLGFVVLKLNRRSIGPLKLNDRGKSLGSGQFRFLTPGKVKLLKKGVNLR